ncbi:MAG: aminotransferase class III-fold pyridoxal phosphate-dependent enzyme [Bacteroidia bacterium]|nr:aminotransferase class III-fold pyridoxal phosphate-dependent enzyme [Bacteroidia bacterium]
MLLSMLSDSLAAGLAAAHFGIAGSAHPLPGEVDFNFRIQTPSGESYILKISRPGADAGLLDFQAQLLDHLARHASGVPAPRMLPALDGSWSARWTDAAGQERTLRMLTWIPGRLWSAVNPKTPALLESLGACCGRVTAALQGFSHPAAQRSFAWNLAQAGWIRGHLHRFDAAQRDLAEWALSAYEAIQPAYARLRMSVVHNDANDNNILAGGSPQAPEVLALIDFGDAVHTRTVNDAAVALAYACMHCPDPLGAARPLLAGYHRQFSLLEDELALLFPLVAMRLAVSVTQSAISREREPGNAYLLISEQPAWDLLARWRKIPPAFAHYAFRHACGYSPVPHREAFAAWAAGQRLSLHALLPAHPFVRTAPLDLSIGSSWLGNFAEFRDDAQFSAKIARLADEAHDALPAGGYLEPRALYSTAAYAREGNEGPEYRTIHLGLDLWAPAGTPVHNCFAGTVYGFADNAGDKDYGPTVILRHETPDGLAWYSLYGHLSRASLEGLEEGQFIPRNGRIGWLGALHENGNWPPHLHFQLLLDPLGCRHDFPGVAYPSEAEIWAAVCPDPAGLFHDLKPLPAAAPEAEAMRSFRRAHLGRSLSLSYREPLTILRGEMQYLLDRSGQRYLDTVNNVAHAGHEHPRVVRAGQAQMAVLNTNTRYLHPKILEFAEALLATLPPELGVLHFVNSGSEANELALRMAQAWRGQRDMIALEIGYHGNTNGCIAVSSYKFDGKGGKGRPEHTQIVPLPDSYRGRYQGSLAETGTRYAAHVQEAVAAIEAQGRGVAGLIAESIVSCGGQIELPAGYLAQAYASVRAAGGLCIADEVQVGFGRVGRHFWGFELQGVVPDIVTMGKPIGNGHPLGAVACTREVAEAFANGMEYFNTFGGNPVSAAIGLEVLRVIRDEGLQAHAFRTGEWLKAELRSLAQRFPLIGDVRGQGFFLGVELTEPGKIPATARTAWLAERMKQRGILMSVDGPQNNVLKIKPPMCFSQDNAEQLIRELERVLGEDALQI